MREGGVAAGADWVHLPARAGGLHAQVDARLAAGGLLRVRVESTVSDLGDRGSGQLKYLGELLRGGGLRATAGARSVRRPRQPERAREREGSGAHRLTAKGPGDGLLDLLSRALSRRLDRVVHRLSRVGDGGLGLLGSLAHGGLNRLLHLLRSRRERLQVVRARERERQTRESV